MYCDLSLSININCLLIGALVSALRTPAALQSAPTAAQPAPSQPTPIVSNSPAHQEADQRVQVLEQELNQQRLLVEQERQARADLEQHLNQERQARAAEVQALQQQLNQERQARAADTQRLQALQQQLNQERQARIAAEESLRHQQAQGTSRFSMPLVPISCSFSRLKRDAWLSQSHRQS